MVFFSKHDLVELEGRAFRVEPRDDFSAISLDVTIGELYRQIPLDAMQRSHDISDDEFLDRFCVRQGVQILDSDSFYLCRLKEKVDIAQDCDGEIASRSSWARLGVRIESLGLMIGHSGHPLCSLKITGTQARVKEGDSVGQLLVYSGKLFEMYPVLRGLFQKGGLKVSGVDTVSWSRERHAMKLTMGPKIHVYRGGILEKGNVECCFETVDLREHRFGYHLPKGTFFISASKERVSIPSTHLGWVKEAVYGDTLVFMSHACAPWIAPRPVFEGNITFENWMFQDAHVHYGMTQSWLSLGRLRTPVTGVEASRYADQKGATLSRL